MIRMLIDLCAITGAACVFLGLAIRAIDFFGL